MRDHRDSDSPIGIMTDRSRPDAPPSVQPAQRQSPWLTPADAAAYLGVAIGTLRNWTSARYVPHTKRGRVVRYHRDALDLWLQRGACQGRSTLPNIR